LPWDSFCQGKDFTSGKPLEMQANTPTFTFHLFSNCLGKSFQSGTGTVIAFLLSCPWSLTRSNGCVHLVLLVTCFCSHACVRFAAWPCWLSVSLHCCFLESFVYLTWLSMARDGDHFFMCFLTIWISSLEKVQLPTSLLTPWFLGSFVFLALCIFWLSILCLMYS
jgi:hypothetical protein